MHGAVVLGASGLVGQRLQQRLANHPMFAVRALAGSPRTAGMHPADLHWGLEGQAPSLDLPPVLDVQDPGLVEQLHALGVSWAFSAVPSDVGLGLILKHLPVIARCVRVHARTRACACCVRAANLLEVSAPSLRPFGLDTAEPSVDQCFLDLLARE